MSYVEVKNLFVDFGGVPAVFDVSFSVETGEILSLLGPSGCGKSTILRVIAGLAEGSSGVIEIAGNRIVDVAAGVSVPSERRGLGMVFQSYAIWPHMTVFENVAFPLRIRGERGLDVERKVNRILEVVELASQAQRNATELSGGQQQRVAIARALVFEPKLLLLDEPLSNLDTKLRDQMRAELKRIQRRTNVTTIYVTHDQEEALALSDRIVVLKKGVVQQVGTPQEIYNAPENRFVGWFIGKANMLRGTVVELIQASDGEGSVVNGARVRLNGTDGTLSCKLSSGKFEAGQNVVVSLRPENIELNSPASDCLVGDVRSSEYLGEAWQHHATVSDQPLYFFTRGETKCDVGQRISLSVKPFACIAFREDSDPVEDCIV